MTTETLERPDGLTDCQRSLRNSCLSIAATLEEPPLVNHDADSDELPGDAVQCESNPSDCVMVHSYDRRVPAEEFENEYQHKSGAYLHDEDMDTWRCAATGKVWEGFGSGFFWSDDGDLILGGDEVTNFGPMSGYDYMSDVLDIEYRVGSEREYRSAEILVGFGGPNIWIDTKTQTVEGRWGSDSFSCPYIDNMGLDEACEELFNC